MTGKLFWRNPKKRASPSKKGDLGMKLYLGEEGTRLGNQPGQRIGVLANNNKVWAGTGLRSFRLFLVLLMRAGAMGM